MTFIKKSLSLFLILFICTRIGLILHELLGHAIPAWLLGWEITGYELSFFYGGWVSYHFKGEHAFMDTFIVQFGGFFVEFFLAAVCFILSKRMNREWLKMLLTILGSLAILHSMFYMTRSVYYGYADGKILFHYLNAELRLVLSCFFAGITVVLSYILSRKFSNYITICFPNSSSLKPLLSFFTHLIAASVLFISCLITEQAITSSDFREQLFKPHHHYEIEKELAQIEKENNTVTKKDRAVVVSKHEPFPIDLIFMLMLPASLLGYLQRAHFTAFQKGLLLNISYYAKFSLIPFFSILTFKMSKNWLLQLM